MTPAQTRVVELARELIGKYDSNGEVMDFQCPICDGTQVFNTRAVEVGEDVLDIDVFCNCDGGRVELLVDYSKLEIEGDLRNLSLALVSLDIEESLLPKVPATNRFVVPAVPAAPTAPAVPELPITMFASAKPPLQPPREAWLERPTGTAESTARAVSAMLGQSSDDAGPPKRQKKLR